MNSGSLWRRFLCYTTPPNFVLLLVVRGFASKDRVALKRLERDDLASKVLAKLIDPGFGQNKTLSLEVASKVAGIF